MKIETERNSKSKLTVEINLKDTFKRTCEECGKTDVRCQEFIDATFTNVLEASGIELLASVQIGKVVCDECISKICIALKNEDQNKED